MCYDSSCNTACASRTIVLLVLKYANLVSLRYLRVNVLKPPRERSVEWPLAIVKELGRASIVKVTAQATTRCFQSAAPNLYSDM